jgi:hypothetical protein
MKKFTLQNLVKGTKAIAVAAFVFAAASTNAQTTNFSATWTLLADPTATTTGNITATQQNLGPLLTGVTYNTSYGTSPNTTTGWQRVGTTSGIRAGSDSAFTQGGYVEYKVTPNAGLYMQIQSVSAELLGGGTGNARLAAYWSRDNFVTMDSFHVTTTYNSLPTRATRIDSVVLINGGSATPALTGQQTISFSPIGISLAAGQTFTLRFYVWLISPSTTVRHLGERNVVISGVTSSTALPVIFSSSKASQKSSGIQVDWSTASESNLSNFVIERSSNGTSFAPVATLTAKGSASAATNYTWYDATPLAGNNYYRIKAVNKDGSILYTSILRVNLSNSLGELVIAPNPVRSHTLNLQLSNFDKGVYSINVFNGQGQKVFSSSINHTGGSATQSFQLPANIKAGMYSLQLANGLTVINRSLIVE